MLLKGDKKRIALWGVVVCDLDLNPNHASDFACVACIQPLYKH